MMMAAVQPVNGLTIFDATQICHSQKKAGLERARLKALAT